MCLRRSFWKSLAFNLVDWVKRSALSNVDRHHPIHRGPQENKQARENSLSSRALSTADAGMAELLVLEPGSCGTGTRPSPRPQPFRLTYATTSFRGSPDQFADNRLWDFRASIDVQVNPYEESPRFYVHTSSFLCFSGEP